MKMIQNKNLIQKILLLLLVVVSFNFICPSVVNAADDPLGGAVVGGVADLITALGDGILNIIHRFVVSQESTLIPMKEGGWSLAGKIILKIVIAAVAALAIYFSLGTFATVIAGLGVTISGLSIFGASTMIGGFVAYATYNNLVEDFYLPVYSISPEEIFYGEIPLLNVNFFDPDKRKNDYDKSMTETTYPTDSIGEIICKYGADNGYFNKRVGPKIDSCIEWNLNGTSRRLEFKYDDVSTGIMTHAQFEYIKFWENNELKIDDKSPGAGGVVWSMHDTIEEIMKRPDYIEAERLSKSDDINEFSHYKISSNVLQWKDKEENIYTLTISNNEKKLEILKKYENIGLTMQPIVAKWYVTLRNVALVISMSILVYIGIRMMLTSIASEKAKYKNMLFDWFIGVALIFVMQYIMVFATYLNDEFIEFISTSKGEYTVIIPWNNSWDSDKSKEGKYYYLEKDSRGSQVMVVPGNLMSQVRVGIQDSRNNSLTYVGYSIVFLVLVFYTAFFLITYLKRVLYMAFLTIVSPFVAMTYSIDKLNDGKAQAFNMWLKEYIFNLLIQPMHLLLYYVLIISAIELAGENIIYSLVAIGFLIPAEKLIRKFFGFDKAQTPGFLGGAAGAGLVMSAVGSLKRFSNSGKSEKNDTKRDTSGKIRTKDNSALTLNDAFGASTSSSQKDEKIRTVEDKSSESSNSDKAENSADNVTEKTKSNSIYTDSKKADSKSDSNKAKSSKAESNAENPEGTKDNKTGKSKRKLHQKLFGAGKAAIGSPIRGAIRLTGKIPNLAARGFGAATLGAVGLAAGIATGDAGNALQYGLTGAGAGSALGSGLANRATNVASGYADDVIRGWYGNEYDKEYLNKKADQQFLSNKENKDFYKSMFGDNYKKAMEEAKEYRKYGITDNKIIAKAMKLKGYSHTEKIYLAQLSKQIGNLSDLARLRESFKRENVPDNVIDSIESGVRTILSKTT